MLYFCIVEMIKGVATTQTIIINQTHDEMKTENLKKWIELVIAVLAAIAGTLSASAMM